MELKAVHAREIRSLRDELAKLKEVSPLYLGLLQVLLMLLLVGCLVPPISLMHLLVAVELVVCLRAKSG